MNIYYTRKFVNLESNESIHFFYIVYPQISHRFDNVSTYFPE